jgi:hypothetical protein
MTATSLIGAFFLAMAIGPQPGSQIARAQSVDCCAQNSAPQKDGSKSRKMKDSNRIDSALISFYAAPLVCRAAPEIGCGSRANPILEGLRHHRAVSEARLNRPGMVIAVIWAKGSTPAARTEAIKTIEKNRDLAMSELNGEKRETARKEFASKANWYRAPEVDRLSEEEADIIAARLVRRVGATVTLSDKQVDELGKTIASTLKRMLTGGCTVSAQSCEAELLGASREHLSEEGMAALKQAISLGYQPLPGEK